MALSPSGNFSNFGKNSSDQHDRHSTGEITIASSLMRGQQLLEKLLRNDPVRWHLLGLVRDLRLPDCWIGAGFVRNAVWDQLHNRQVMPPKTDIDVIYFDRSDASPSRDTEIQASLQKAAPEFDWDVKNQVRMHIRNGDKVYTSCTDALANWTETATAVAVRRRGEDFLDIAAPYGLEDLMSLILRPTPRFVEEKATIYRDRLNKKRWTEQWPLLREEPGLKGANMVLIDVE